MSERKTMSFPGKSLEASVVNTILGWTEPWAGLREQFLSSFSLMGIWAISSMEAQMKNVPF